MVGHDITEFYAADAPAARLAAAAARGDSAEVAALARAGADPNAPGREGMLPLSWALLAKSEPGVRALLVAGADPNRRTGAGQPSPISLVVGAPDTRWLAFLLAHGGSPDALTRRDEPLLFQAIGQKHLESVRLLVEHGANLNARGVGEQTPVILAAHLNQFHLVRYLLERGADWRLELPGGGSLAVAVQGARVAAEFSEAVAALEWTREYLVARGVRFPVEEPWQRREREAQRRVSAPT